jgi:hypothetical protein
MILYLSDNNINSKTWNGTEKQDFFSYQGINYLNKIKDLNIIIEKVELPETMKLNNLSPIHESDLYRYYLLYSKGGFYCDMDVLFFRSIDSFYQNIIRNNIDTILYQCSTYVAIGFLGSSINNTFYKDLFEFGIKNFNSNDYQSMGVDLFYSRYGGHRRNPFIITNIMSRNPNLNIQSISSELIYHFDWTKISYNFSNMVYPNNFPKESIGYHWYGGSEISQYHNNIMNENNYREFSNTFSAIAKKILE